MRELLHRLFGRKETETVVLPLPDFPDVFRERERDLLEQFTSSAADPIRNIRNAEAQLRHIVNTIEGAEDNPELHPKLRSIAKNSLPQFVRSMNTVLAKRLPDEPEEFYTSAVETVKGCLNSVKGPGRYLQLVFPEELKAARNGIDLMGREINVLTRALGTYRAGMAVAADARAAYEELVRARTECKKADEKALRIAQRSSEIEARLAAIGRELESLQSDPRMSDAEGRKMELQKLEAQREETARAYASLSMTASHIFRKCEKIAVRQKHSSEIVLLRTAMTLLSDHELPAPERLGQALADACPVATRMIDNGEIPLKNKEERAVFADPLQFQKEMRSTCSQLAAHEEACRRVAEEIAVHPAIAKRGSLERERAQLVSMLEKEKAQLADLALFKEKTRDRIPALTEDLRKKTGAIMGKNVQVQDRGTGPV